MKRIVSISLSIFLVMGAVVLYSGGTQANAQDVSNLWAGEWSCDCRKRSGPTLEQPRNRSSGIKHMIIQRDGTVTANSIFVERGTWGERFTELRRETGTAAEGLLRSLRVNYEGQAYRATAIYIGQGRNPLGRYVRTRFLMIGTPDDIAKPQWSMEGDCARINPFQQSTP